MVEVALRLVRDSFSPKDSDTFQVANLGSSRRPDNRHWTRSYIISSLFELRRWARARYDQTSDERCYSLLRKCLLDSFFLRIPSSTTFKGMRLSYRDKSIRIVQTTEQAVVWSYILLYCTPPSNEADRVTHGCNVFRQLRVKSFFGG